MPVILDNDEFQVVETVYPGGKTLQLIPKPGSRLENSQTLQYLVLQYLGLLDSPHVAERESNGGA